MELTKDDIAVLIWVLGGLIDSDDEITRSVAKSHKLSLIKSKLKQMWDNKQEETNYLT